MQEGLIDFINLPRQSLAATSQPLHFILDQALYPDLLKELSAHQGYAFDYLLIGTDFASRASSGPIWLSAQSGSAIAEWCMNLCQHRHAGIAIVATNSELALKHARWLLKVNDGSGGQSWVTYYQPALCAALLGTTQASSMSQLLGPWSAVYAPSPRHIQGLLPGWLRWQTNHPVQVPTTPLFNLPPCTEPTYVTLRWVYWLDQQYAAFHQPDVGQLSPLIDNLNLVLEHQIYESAHLLQLAELMVRTDLATQPAVMTILRGADQAFSKVEQLQALMDLPDSRKKQSTWN
ncbi:DUF4123 domain-containing protein [Pseudomonas alkylphenolica]|uniref:DUF4123 domain-containing protein n=1 Tax=Pseudomonas alkylphenolica TaxID=237609 RepID=A0A077FDK9_9PSED|nr:DUF4123 domain-containing protein [Pseudomonas alkylphenolica]AIL61361.1 hypothetical protein PSAKL28_21400 [Pseudomonas alkylphenolica]